MFTHRPRPYSTSSIETIPKDAPRTARIRLAREAGGATGDSVWLTGRSSHRLGRDGDPEPLVERRTGQPGPGPGEKGAPRKGPSHLAGNGEGHQHRSRSSAAQSA